MNGTVPLRLSVIFLTLFWPILGWAGDYASENPQQALFRMMQSVKLQGSLTVLAEELDCNEFLKIEDAKRFQLVTEQDCRKFAVKFFEDPLSYINIDRFAEEAAESAAAVFQVPKEVVVETLKQQGLIDDLKINAVSVIERIKQGRLGVGTFTIEGDRAKVKVIVEGGKKSDISEVSLRRINNRWFLTVPPEEKDEFFADYE